MAVWDEEQLRESEYRSLGIEKLRNHVSYIHVEKNSSWLERALTQSSKGLSGEKWESCKRAFVTGLYM